MLSMILQGQAGETDECVLALGALGGPGARVGIWSPAGWLCKELVGSGIVPNWARLQRGVETPHADLVARARPADSWLRRRKPFALEPRFPRSPSPTPSGPAGARALLIAQLPSCTHPH